MEKNWRSPVEVGIVVVYIGYPNYLEGFIHVVQDLFHQQYGNILIP